MIVVVECIRMLALCANAIGNYFLLRKCVLYVCMQFFCMQREAFSSSAHWVVCAHGTVWKCFLHYRLLVIITYEDGLRCNHSNLNGHPCHV